MEIDWSSKTTIKQLHVWMDGGSVTLVCFNMKHQSFTIEFVQNVFWEVPKSSKLPGRIYLNNELIEQRTGLEIKLLENLKKAILIRTSSFDENILLEKINYAESNQYLVDSDKVKLRERKTTPKKS